MNPLDAPIQIEVDCQEFGDESEITDGIRRAVRASAASQGFTEGSIGVLITDDTTIHQINREHLDHDYPTDVISFGYSRRKPRVEGELVASFDTAKREATALQWSAFSELLLYVVHGTLHICGLEDSTVEQQTQMRLAEQKVLSELGIEDSGRFVPEVIPKKEGFSPAMSPKDSCSTC